MQREPVHTFPVMSPHFVGFMLMIYRAWRFYRKNRKMAAHFISNCLLSIDFLSKFVFQQKVY